MLNSFLSPTPLEIEEAILNEVIHARWTLSPFQTPYYNSRVVLSSRKEDQDQKVCVNIDNQLLKKKKKTRLYDFSYDDET